MQGKRRAAPLAICDEAAALDFDYCNATDKMWAFIESLGGKTHCVLTDSRGTAMWAAENDAIIAAGPDFAAELGIKTTGRNAEGCGATQTLDGVDERGNPARIVYAVSKRHTPTGSMIVMSCERHLAW